MSLRSKLARCVVALGVVTAGIIADRTQLTAATCDSQCRMRQYHFFCDSGPCVYFAQFSCMLCQPGFTFQCETRERVVFPTCSVPLKNQNIVYYYNYCDTICSCGGTTSAVEATN